MAWRPGRRAHERALEDPYEDVPDHLAQPLWEWIQGGLFEPYTGDDRTGQLGIDLRLALGSTQTERGRRLAELCRQNSEFMLDLVEAMLERYGWDQGRADWLNELLRDANSVYTLRDWSGLEMRVTPEVKEQVQAVVDGAIGSAGDHLTNAWNDAYGRTPDPAKSFGESIRAVEAALAQVVEPNNAKSTLGSMIGVLRSNPSGWVFVIEDGPHSDGVGTLLELMRLLWEGQTSRHGGAGPTRHETVEEAQAAVHIATTLVQFGLSGALTRRPVDSG